MGEGAVDELREVDAGNANNEKPETAHRDAERRREAPGQWRIVFDKGADVCDCAKP